MKKLFTLFALFIVLFVSNAQDCVDSTVIDPNMLCSDQYFPVCGCDGNTYPNSCVAYYEHGITEYTNGTCESQIDTCISELQLEWGQLVDCVADYVPVCGCNQVTYSNSCSAFYYGGVTTYSVGHCDSSMYCPIIPSMVDFGACDMALGFVRTPEGCVMKSGCSRVGNNGVDYSEYFYEFEYACNSICDTAIVITCVDETLIDPNAICPAVWDPVCGCNNVTYGNECEATNFGGVTMWTPGPCKTAGVNEQQIELVSTYPNPTTDELNITISSNKTAIHIHNLQGALVWSSNGSSMLNFKLNIATWPAGLYIISAHNENGLSSSSKVVKLN